MAKEPKAEQLTGRASIRAGSYQPGEGLIKTPGQKAAEGQQPEPTTVSMEVLRDGSYGGEYRHAGDTIDVPEDTVETLTLAGFAARADRVETAQQARDDAARESDADKVRQAGRSTAVAPMSTHDTPGAEPAKQE